MIQVNISLFQAEVLQAIYKEYTFDEFLDFCNSTFEMNWNVNNLLTEIQNVFGRLKVGGSFVIQLTICLDISVFSWTYEANRKFAGYKRCQESLKVQPIRNISLFSARQTFQLCYISMHIKVTDKQTNE